MKIQNIKLVFTLILTPFVIFGLFFIFKNRGDSKVKAYGALSVTFPSTPVFNEQNLLPGDCVNKEILVENSSDQDAVVAVRSKNEIDENGLSQVFNLEISENSDSLYNHPLSQFFQDSDDPDGVPLSTLAANNQTSYNFNVCFDQDAGNEFQEASVIFDLVFGEILDNEIELPSECQHLRGIITTKIEGTPGNDHIKGTSASELIIGYGGKDYIHGNAGHDCIIGGDGDDKLKGGSGDDTIVGGDGKDFLWGQSGDDTIYGNEGDDKLWGNSGFDFLWGGPGKDELKGNSGDDYLNGQEDRDKLWGDTGRDTCLNGEFLQSCEL